MQVILDLGRIGYANALVSNQVAGIKVDAARWEGKDPAEISRDILGRSAAPETLGVITGAMPPKTIAALILGSPEFNRR